MQPAAFPKWRDQNPREEGVLLWGQETQAQRPDGVLRATDTEVSPRLLVPLSRPGSQSLGAPLASAGSQSTRWCLAGREVWPNQASGPCF